MEPTGHVGRVGAGVRPGHGIIPAVSNSDRASIELTPAGIPASLRPFFQDCVFESVNPETDAFTVIERTLSCGNRRELRWLFHRYPRRQLAAFVRDAGWWRIPPHRFYYWLNLFGITDYRQSDYPRIWPH